MFQDAFPAICILLLRNVNKSSYVVRLPRARIVIVDSGRLPDNDDDPRMATLREALIALGNHADQSPDAPSLYWTS